jgi:hypothetical protein
MDNAPIPTEPTIKVYLTEQEIISGNCDRLLALFGRQDNVGLRALHQSVEVILPRKFASRFAKLSFEHPKVRAFAIALLGKLPGISFFLHPRSLPVIKQLLFASLPTIRIARHGRKAMVNLPHAEFWQAGESEIDAASDLAKKAGFRMVPVETFALYLRAFFDGPKYR